MALRRVFSIGLALAALGAAGLQPASVRAQPATSGGAAANAPLPAEVFMRRDMLSAARLSPSGRWLAFTALTSKGRYGLAVLDLDAGRNDAMQMVAHIRDVDVDDFYWVGEDRLVFDMTDHERAGGDQRYNPGLVSIRRDGSDERALITRGWYAPSPHVSVHRHNHVLSAYHALLHVPDGPGTSVIVGEYVYGAERELVEVLPKRLNIVTGLTQSLASGAPDQTTWWLFDAAGRPRLAWAGRDGVVRVHWREKTLDDSPTAWKQIATFSALKPEWLPHSLDDKGRLFVTAEKGVGGYKVLKRFDFATGKPSADDVVSTPGFDFSGRLVSETRGSTALGLRVDTDAEATIWFDARLKVIQAEIDRRLPGRINRLTCRRCDRPDMTVLVRSYSDQDPGAWWVWRGEAAAPTLWRRVAVARSGIDPQRMATLDFHRYKARDGLEIPLWVTRPVGHKDGEPLPTVVMPHGGPWVRGGHWSWSGWPQFLASRGYLVLEPEFRGSHGFGRAHEKAGYKKWGTAMQDDLADAVAWAAQRKVADPKRVCIAGASYGGYATFMSLVRHPDVYRCGAAWMAVTEPMLMFESTWENDSNRETQRHFLPTILGDPVADVDLLRAASPVQQAARIKAPVLLAMGAADRRVPLRHGTLMRDALKAAGNEPEYVVYDGEAHGFYTLETRLDFARRLEEFLARHLR